MRALLIVDLQRDFCPGGALPVAGGDNIVPNINKLVAEFRDSGDLIVASKDWHPETTVHFKKDGGMWPIHCVANTNGAKFHPNLDPVGIKKVFVKGTENDDKGYSSFEATDANLAEYLKSCDVDELVIVGLATDYCVKATVLDALNNGFKVTVPRDSVAAVNITATDGESAIAEMEAKGAVFI
jgi:nicotinamidase/pyrazinamidase